MRPRSELAALALCALPRVVAAQESADEVARRALIADAETARAAGDHARALALATRAGAERMTPSLRQLIAYEHDAVGHVVEALDQAEACAREARGDVSLRNREQILAACESLAERERARVGWLTVRVPEPAPEGLRVTVGGEAMHAAMYGVARPRPPGAVTVEATTADASFHRVAEVRAGERAEVLVDPVADRVRVVVRERMVTPPTPTAAPPPRVAPWVLVGAGGLALATAGVFAALREDARSDRDAARDAQGYDRPEAQGYDDRFRAYTVATDVALGVGAAAVVGGFVWWWLGRRTTSTSGVTAGVSPAIGGAMIAVGVTR